MATDVLDKIVTRKREDIDTARRQRPEDDLRALLADAPPVRDFEQALRAAYPMGLIAEVKKASPSAGLIRPDFHPVEIAKTYEQHGAACISVLTEEHFFQGHLDFLVAIRKEVSIPVLRKDFLIDPYQVVEARAAGADCVLLIAECLDDATMQLLYDETLALGMQALIEIYEPKNLQRVLDLTPRPTFLGVNNRNLRTFVTDLGHCVRLREEVPADTLLVGESGIHTRADVERLQSAGIHAMLVGESLMRHPAIGPQVDLLLGTASTNMC
ncbi:MAG: indole-3-glycerol phosphate synthase TrpC [Planctomycetaceae bacterium]